MLRNPCKTLGYMKNMVFTISPGGGKPYSASGLYMYTLPVAHFLCNQDVNVLKRNNQRLRLHTVSGETTKVGSFSIY